MDFYSSGFIHVQVGIVEGVLANQTFLVTFLRKTSTATTLLLPLSRLFLVSRNSTTSSKNKNWASPQNRAQVLQRIKVATDLPSLSSVEVAVPEVCMVEEYI